MGKAKCLDGVLFYISWPLLWSSDAMSRCCVVMEKWVDDQAVARLGLGSVLRTRRRMMLMLGLGDGSLP
jgi:hypothetical protein